METLALKRATTNAAAGGFMLATDVADYLVGRGMPFRKPRGRRRHGRSLIERDLSFSRSRSKTGAPTASYSARTSSKDRAPPGGRRPKTPQSTSPAAVADALDDARGWLKSHDRCGRQTVARVLFAPLLQAARFNVQVSGS